MYFKCPGQDRRNLQTQIIICPGCGRDAEIFSDEMRVKCFGCGALFSRQKPSTCLDWCKSAQICAGANFRGGA